MIKKLVAVGAITAGVVMGFAGPAAATTSHQFRNGDECERVRDADPRALQHGGPCLYWSDPNFGDYYYTTP